MLNGLSTTGYRLEIKINFPKLFNLAKPPSLKRSLLLCRPYRSSSFLPSVGELADAISREKHICIRSLDPAPVFQHLALEEWILSFLEEAVDLNNEYRVLLFYVNKPCVVIGRNQLIWNECDPSIITTARRMSGGGAVYHDPGNLNFSLFTPKHLFRRERGIEALRTSLQAEIPASLLRTSTFHDLFLSEKKVSGSAFRIARGCAYHHGTALFCSDLQMLSKALKPKEFPDFFISSMGASKSRRSFVANINDHYPNLKVASIIDGMAKFLGIPNFHSIGANFAWHQDLKFMKTLHTLQSAEWIIGNNPEFSIACRMTGKQTTIARGTAKLPLELGGAARGFI